MFLMSCCLVNSKQTFDKRLGCHSVRIRSRPVLPELGWTIWRDVRSTNSSSDLKWTQIN
jgi:hypothetical protein